MGIKLYHLLHPEQPCRDVWNGDWIPRGCKTTGRAGDLWAAPQLWWGVCGEAQMEPDWKRLAEAGEMFGLAQSLPSCALHQPLPWKVLKREVQLFIQTGTILGRGGGLLLAIVSHLLCVLPTLCCVSKEGNEALCCFSSPDTSNFWRTGPLYSLY